MIGRGDRRVGLPGSGVEQAIGLGVEGGVLVVLAPLILASSME